ARSIESLGPILAQVDNPVEVRLYIERVAQKFGIADIDAVRAQLRRGVRQDRSKPRRQDPSSNASARRDDADGVRESSQRSDAHAQSPTSRRGQSDTPTSASARRLSPLECEVVGVFLDQPSLFDSEEGGNVTELLTNPDLRRIFQSAREIVTERGAIDAPTLLERLQDNSALPWLEGRLAVQEHELEAAKETLRTGIPRLVEERVTGELSRMSEEIQAARRAGDEERAMVLTRERDTLRRSVLSPQQTTNPAQR
ncbi:MAG: hypothetical protein KC417_04395, partial [Myxococcales bacterium]|nr:hypothetical protein [Myxococcales bacterium]